MNPTLSEKLYDTRDESSAPKSPSISSKPTKSSGSFKAGDKKQKRSNSSSETPEEKAQRRSEKNNENKNDKKEDEDKQENSHGGITDDDARVFTQETVKPDETKESLMCMVKTLRRRLEEVESENRQLTEINSAYSTQLEEQRAYRKELNGVQEELEQLRHERDKAIYRAGELTIESGKVSESYDRVAESKVVIEQMRRMIQTSLTQQSSSASVRGVSKKFDRRSGMSSFSALPISRGFRKLGSLLSFRKKNDDKTLVSTYDDDCMLDLTEDNTSVGSEDLSNLERTLFDLERTDFAEPHSSMAFFIDNLNCSSDQLHNRRLLKMDLMLDPSKNKK
jgi:hypothetical protein